METVSQVQAGETPVVEIPLELLQDSTIPPEAIRLYLHLKRDADLSRFGVSMTSFDEMSSWMSVPPEQIREWLDDLLGSGFIGLAPNPRDPR